MDIMLITYQCHNNTTPTSLIPFHWKNLGNDWHAQAKTDYSKVCRILQDTPEKALKHVQEATKQAFKVMPARILGDSFQKDLSVSMGSYGCTSKWWQMNCNPWPCISEKSFNAIGFPSQHALMRALFHLSASKSKHSLYRHVWKHWITALESGLGGDRAMQGWPFFTSGFIFVGRLMPLRTLRTTGSTFGPSFNE